MNNFILSCPSPFRQQDKIQLAHGGGGLLMHQLLEKMILPSFSNPQLAKRHDGAILQFGNSRIAFTTDSYVVHPLFFPGGDIGSLAINGTVNDLAMCGAKPVALSVALILEEGLPLATLQRVVESMRQAANQAGVLLVTGDTKVVDKGKGDGLYINTAGIGEVNHSLHIEPESVRAGDAILLSGDIGRHGMAIMSAREGLSFESPIESDCAPLHEPILALLEEKIIIHCLRDLTRGGLATNLVEIAQGARMAIHFDETAIPVREDVRSACEILGFDPLYVANEGRFIVFLPAAQTDRALDLLRHFPVGAEACKIGEVRDHPAALVTMTTRYNSSLVIDMLSGEQLPRIC